MPDSTPATSPTGPSLADFASFYLYGLTTEPYRQSADLTKFGALYNLVIGHHGVKAENDG